GPVAKKGLVKPASEDLIKEAGKVPPTSDDVETFAKKWATESVGKARSAFEGLTFTGKTCKKKLYWLVDYDDRGAYLKAQKKMKREQLVAAGARLAQLLNTIWP